MYGFSKINNLERSSERLLFNPKEQLFSYHDENKLLLGWKDDDYGTRPTHLVRFL